MYAWKVMLEELSMIVKFSMYIPGVIFDGTLIVKLIDLLVIELILIQEVWVILKELLVDIFIDKLRVSPGCIKEVELIGVMVNA